MSCVVLLGGTSPHPSPLRSGVYCATAVRTASSTRCPPHRRRTGDTADSVIGDGARLFNSNHAGPGSLRARLAHDMLRWDTSARDGAMGAGACRSDHVPRPPANRCAGESAERAPSSSSFVELQREVPRVPDPSRPGEPAFFYAACVVAGDYELMAK